MDLSVKLKQITQPYHVHIETVPLLKKLGKSTISFPEYQTLLTKFYTYMKPCEAQIAQSANHQLLQGRAKVALLEQDFVALGIATNIDIDYCLQIPKLSTYESILGYLYVVEGATLGGQILGRCLNKCLALTPAQGAAYFNGYGLATAQQWQTFCQILNAVVCSTQQENIVASAIATYETLDNWLRN